MLIRPPQSSPSSIESLECRISHYPIVCPPQKLTGTSTIKQGDQTNHNLLQRTQSYSRLINSNATHDNHILGFLRASISSPGRICYSFNKSYLFEVVSLLLQLGTFVICLKNYIFLSLYLFTSNWPHLREIFTTWLSGFPGAQMAVLHNIQPPLFAHTLQLLGLLLIRCRSKNCASCYQCKY